jgi:hypothetical protein
MVCGNRLAVGADLQRLRLARLDHRHRAPGRALEVAVERDDTEVSRVRGEHLGIGPRLVGLQHELLA